MRDYSKLAWVSGTALIALTCSAGFVRGQDLMYMTFDADAQSFPCGGWDAERVYSWDSALDGQTNAASGSLRVDVAFTSTSQNTTLQTCVAITDLKPYEKVRMDVYLDPTNAPTTSGNYGTISLRFRPGWAWPGDVVNLGTITNTGWTHFEAAMPVTVTSASGVNVHWTTGGYSDPRTIWIDNIVFVAATAPPAAPTLGLRKAGPGLEIRTTGDPDTSRKNIATVDTLAGVLSWLNSAGPVTYSMTINESVEPGSSGYAANILLCAGTDVSINASPDWNQHSGVFMEAVQTEAGTFDVSVRYKTNAPSSHGIRFAGDSTNGYPGLLILKTNTGVTSLVGTWALSLSNATVELSGPGGISGSAQMPEEALQWFGPGNNFWALFGAQPYTRNNRTISLSRVRIHGPTDFAGTVDQDFTTAAELDPNLEPKQEGVGGVVLKPTNTAWRVFWGLPDPGMYLWSSPTVKSNDWAYLPVTPLTQGAQRTVFTTNVSAGAGFFQLRNYGPVEPPPPPTLLESFETGAWTGANPPYTNLTQSSTIGVTEGTYALQVNFDSSGTWSWMANSYPASSYTDWRSHSKIAFDLHREAELFGWNLEMAVAINGAMGWNQAQVVNWVWLNAGASSTETITWDYSSIKAAAPETGTYFQLNFMLRGGYGGNAYIDNVRFIE